MKACPTMCAAALLALAFVPAAPVRAAGDYHVVTRFEVGGEGGWDILTVDPDAHRLYYGRGTRMQVLDLESGKVVGEVPDTPGIHGVALVPELGRGFTSNGRDSSVTIFDLKTLAVLGRVHVDGRNADAILYEPVTKRVFVFNPGSHNATAIDPAKGTVVANVALDGQPEFAVADGAGRVFVNLEDSSAVDAIDARELKVVSRWPLVGGDGPTGIALDREHHRLFSACHNETMVVLDSRTGRPVATIPIGKGPDGAEFDPATGLAFSPNGEGTLTVIHEDSPDHFRVVATVPTQRGARTMALDPKSHRLYLAAARYGDPPPPTEEHPHPRPPMLPGSFVVLEMDR